MLLLFVSLIVFVWAVVREGYGLCHGIVEKGKSFDYATIIFKGYTMYYFRSVYLVMFLLSCGTLSVLAQDAAVYSKYSESLNKAIKQEVEKLSLIDLQKILSLTSVKPVLDQYNSLKNTDFKFSLSGKNAEF